jgi:hypothetical protein
VRDDISVSLFVRYRAANRDVLVAMILGAILIDVFMTRSSDERGTKTNIANRKLCMRGTINKSYEIKRDLENMQKMRNVVSQRRTT